MALVNIWHLRKVAEASSKACDICYKPTTSVLITPDNKDFFYVCLGHLKNSGFCTPIIDEAETETKRKEAIKREIELIKEEYEEKMKKKRKNQDKTSKDEEKGKEKAEADENKEDDDERANKEKDDKISAITSKETSSTTDDIPRVYALQKTFYQKRLDRKRNAEMARRNQERLRNPTFFPSVPTVNPK